MYKYEWRTYLSSEALWGSVLLFPVTAQAEHAHPAWDHCTFTTAKAVIRFESGMVLQPSCFSTRLIWMEVLGLIFCSTDKSTELQNENENK